MIVRVNYFRIVCFVLIICIITGCGKKVSEDELIYDMSCSYDTSYENGTSVHMEFNLYQKSGKVMQDGLVVWSSSKGDLVVPSDGSEDEYLNMWYTTVRELFPVQGVSVQTNNYLKAGKVYLSETISFENYEYNSVDSLVEHYEDLSFTCQK